MRSVVLLWFESGEPGSAAGQHLTGTLQRLNEAGIPVDRSVVQRVPDRGGWLARLKRLGLAQFRGVASGGRNVILLVRMHPAALIPVLVQRLRGGRTVLMVQGNIADMHAAYPFTKWLPVGRLFIRPTLASATSLVVPNEGILEWVNREIGSAEACTTIVENGFDGDAVSSVTEVPEEELAAAGLQRGQFAVFVGKFAAWQGVDSLLAAVEADDWPPDLPLLFIGDGAERVKVEDAAETNSLVRYLGRVRPDRALAWTQAAAIALAARRSGPASDRGVSPYKVLEASALGTPLVATSVRGQAELVEQLGSGVLVPPDDAYALAKAVKMLWENEALRDALSATGAVRAHTYSWRAGSEGLAQALIKAGWIEQ